MLSKKGAFLVIVLMVIAVALTGRARLILDKITEPFRNDFREMLYLPRGNALKVMACGFDAPLSDALFIKSLVYFGDSMRAVQQKDVFQTRRGYTYELFDVITDLSPRFYRAYQVGALFLTSSASLDTNRQGIQLLNKGVAFTDSLLQKGESLRPDPRWLFHILLANTYMVNIQPRLRAEGKVAEAQEVREITSREFRMAAASPYAPLYVIMAAAGYESSRSGKGNPEDTARIMLNIWMELYEEAKARGDKEVQTALESYIDDAQERLDAITDTRQLQDILSAAGARYLARHGAAPVGTADLLQDGLIPGVPKAPMGTEDKPDSWLALPDGAFKSRELARMESLDQIDLIEDGVIAYRRVHKAAPPTLQTLVDEQFLDFIPTPPLAGLGQSYLYDSTTGTVTNAVPLGPELPPERR